MLFLRSSLLDEAGAVHGFSVRTGGVSSAPYDSLNLGGAVGDAPEAVARNKALLLAAAGLDPVLFTTVSQVHGDRVVFARAGAEGVLLSERPGGPALAGTIEADAIVAAPGVAAGVRTADCVPVLLFDPASGAAAAIHAGWRGTVARIVVRTIQALVDAYGSRPGELFAAIGPAIGPCCFEVGADVATRFATEKDFGPAVVRAPENNWGPRVDLIASNRRLLLQAGLQPTRIDVLEQCTMCERDLFFSHRRDAGKTGRHLSFVRGGRARS